MDLEGHKQLVRRLVNEAINQKREDVLDEVAADDVAWAARLWIGPFRQSFPDFSMDIVDLIAEGDKVAAHFRCSGTHAGEWMGRAPTGRRFHDVDEIYIFTITDGKLSSAVAVEDNLARLQQLGLLSSDLTS